MSEFSNAILGILGATGTIIPMGDPRQENSAKTTFTTLPGASGLAATFTYSKASSLFVPSTQFTKNRHKLPYLGFNGVDQQMDTPSNAYWSRGDGLVDNPFSFGIMVNSVDNTDPQFLLGKGIPTGLDGEWAVDIVGTGVLRFRTTDASAGIAITRQSDAIVTQGRLTLFVVTYHGTVDTYIGSTAMNGAKLYADENLISSTATNNASYVAMEALASVVAVGSRSDETATTFITGVGLMPFFVQAELTAAQVARLHAVYRQFMRTGFVDYRRLGRR